MDQNPPTRLASHSTADGEPPTQRSSQWPPAPDNSRRCCFCAGLTIRGLVDLTEKHDSQRIFRGSAPYEHHASIGDLERSADLGCDFCQFIIDCLKAAQFARLRQGGVFVEEDPLSDEYSKRAGQSLYTLSKEMDEPSQVWLAITSQMRRNLPPGEAFSSDVPISEKVYDTLRVGLGNLPPMLLNLTVSRNEPICFRGFRVGRYAFDPELGSPANLSIAKRWLDDCRNNHIQSCLVKSSSLPTRVLDVGMPSQSLLTCRLVETGGEEGSYVTLSHCWGGKISKRLTKDTLSTFLLSIQISELPANFRDAIYVTRQLGLRYLWIDALCILQDSSEDWAIESEKMGSTYQDSTLTIFASTARGSTEGFLKVAHQPQLKPTTLKVLRGTKSQKSVLVTAREVMEEDLGAAMLSSALSMRGWAFQESYLSRQSLYFGARQLYWKCPKEFNCLEGAYPDISSYDSDRQVILPNAHGQLGKGDENAMQWHFYQAVSVYSNRALTHSSDKLPAFSGLAQRFHPAFGGTYLAGLWSTDFHNGLVWSLWRGVPSSSYSAVQPYRAPSWSWASTNEWIYYDPWQGYPFLQLHSWDVWPRSEHNPYGEVLPGSGSTMPFVIVSGPTMPFIRGNKVPGPDDQGLPKMSGEVTFDVLEELEELAETDSGSLLLTIVDNAYMLSPTCDETEQEQYATDPVPRPPRKYLALAVRGRSRSTDEAHFSGLVLRESNDAFERVGTWVMEFDSVKWSWKGWENKTLKLI